MENNLRISTMTQIGEFNTLIDLNKLYDNLEINDIIKYVEYGSKGEKGEKIKKIKKPKIKSLILKYSIMENYK